MQAPATIIVELEISKRWAEQNPALAYERLRGFIVAQSGRKIALAHETPGFLFFQATGTEGDAA